MKLLIYGINYAPELTGIGKYTGELADWFNHQKVDVRVIAAPPYYPNWKIAPNHSGKWYTKKDIDGIEVVRCPLFVPSQPSTLTRLLHLCSFSFSSFWTLFFYLRWRPDAICLVVPTLFCAPNALLFGAISDAKTIIHIQDYEIDAMFGLGMMKKGLFARIASNIESWLLRRFDRVSTISNSMMSLAAQKGVNLQQILYLPNWVDTDHITPAANGNAYREKWGFTADHHLVLYSGNVGQKQGIEIIVEAARTFQENTKVQFVIVGQGAYRKKLKQLARKTGLSNIHFKDLVPYDDLPQLLAMADIHLVIQKKGAADVVLPSKLTSILSAGGYALITAEKDTEMGLLVEKYPGIAELVEPEDLHAFVKGIERLLEMNTKTTNRVAREYAVRHLNKDIVLSRFHQDLHELCNLSVET